MEKVAGGLNLFFRLSALMLVLTVVTGCQADGQEEAYDWGETAKTGTMVITPEAIEVNSGGTDAEYFDLDGSLQEVIIDVAIENTADEAVTVDRDFYDESFRVVYQEEGIDGNVTSVRMDLDVMPLRVYRGKLEAGESIDTKLILAMDEGELQSLIASDQGSSEVQWKIE